MKGTKHDQGKLRWDLLPFKPIQEVIKVLMVGAEEYDDYNWKKVPGGRRRYFNASCRHSIDEWWVEGKTEDDDTGYHPLAHAICNLLFLLWLDLTGNWVEEKTGENDVDQN